MRGGLASWLYSRTSRSATQPQHLELRVTLGGFQPPERAPPWHRAASDGGRPLVRSRGAQGFPATAMMLRLSLFVFLCRKTLSSLQAGAVGPEGVCLAPAAVTNGHILSCWRTKAHVLAPAANNPKLSSLCQTSPRSTYEATSSSPVEVRSSIHNATFQAILSRKHGTLRFSQCLPVFEWGFGLKGRGGFVTIGNVFAAWMAGDRVWTQQNGRARSLCYQWWSRVVKITLSQQAREPR